MREHLLYIVDPSCLDYIQWVYSVNLKQTEGSDPLSIHSGLLRFMSDFWVMTQCFGALGYQSS
jgi:hypothetical protein